MSAHERVCASAAQDARKLEKKAWRAARDTRHAEADKLYSRLIAHYGAEHDATGTSAPRLTEEVNHSLLLHIKHYIIRNLDIKH